MGGELGGQPFVIFWGANRLKWVSIISVRVLFGPHKALCGQASIVCELSSQSFISDIKLTGLARNIPCILLVVLFSWLFDQSSNFVCLGSYVHASS